MIRRPRFDRDQTGATGPRNYAASSRQEAFMRKSVSRVATARAAHSHENFVALWSTALWVLALVYLLTTFRVY
jgi:hypothetical protein